MKAPLALWIFGPIGSGKSDLLERLPLAGFQRVQADDELERRMQAQGLKLAVADHGDRERREFRELRAQVTLELWGRVPGWRQEGRNLAFETTGDKPPVFQIEIEAGRELGYHSLGCGLRTPLADCLARNRQRPRVLADAAVQASWAAFERSVADGTYARLFAAEELILTADFDEADAFVRAWLERFR
ncbi:MAG: hypothetical protein JSR82_16220 [Verrucomicrobia bacterium]|nr:hypothetical protein [Verrucomicrobiota bacterium]